jgi:lipopolysaccharide transport protein LptA
MKAMVRLLALAAFAGLLGAGAAPAKAPPAKPAAPAAKPAPSASPNPPGSLPGEFSNIGGFDTITTRSIDTNLNTGVFSVPQHFTASRADTQISADKATGNTRTKTVHAVGNVIVHRSAPLQGGDTRIGPEPSTLTCDKLDVDGGKKFYVASGNVHFTQGTRDATADRGTLDEVTGLLHLSGSVHIRDKEQYLDGDDVVYNTKTGDVRATGNPVMVRAPAATPVPTDEGLTATPSPKPKKR